MESVDAGATEDVNMSVAEDFAGSVGPGGQKRQGRVLRVVVVKFDAFERDSIRRILFRALQGEGD